MSEKQESGSQPKPTLSPDTEHELAINEQRQRHRLEYFDKIFMLVKWWGTIITLVTVGAEAAAQVVHIFNP